ncbi:MAG TPA: hypothetical protein VHB21_18620, partial [Minicystis sp.]|nr:hypothetical protein [Minicystis sp.]
ACDAPRDAEVYRASTGEFAPAGTTTWPHEDATAAVLAEGARQYAVVVGGSTPHAERVELGAGGGWSWADAGSMLTARVEHTATVLGEPLVAAPTRWLVCGGIDPASGAALATCELRTAGAFSTTPIPLLAARYGHAAVYREGPPEGVLVIGGDDLGTAEFLPLDTLVSTPVADRLPDPVREFGAALRPMPENVIVSGGLSGSEAPTATDRTGGFTPKNRWIDRQPLAQARARHFTITLPKRDENVLVAGGVTSSAGQPLRSAEVFAPLHVGDPCTDASECEKDVCENGICCLHHCPRCQTCGEGGECYDLPAGTRDARCNGGSDPNHCGGVCAEGGTCVQPERCGRFVACRHGTCQVAPGETCKQALDCVPGAACRGGACRCASDVACSQGEVCSVNGNCTKAPRFVAPDVACSVGEPSYESFAACALAAAALAARRRQRTKPATSDGAKSAKAP